MNKVRNVSICVVLLAVFCFASHLCTPAFAGVQSKDISQDNVTVSGTDDYKITGTTSSYRITVDANYSGTITLDGVSITSNADGPAFQLKDNANVHILLKGSNELTSQQDRSAGLQVPQNTSVTLDDSGNGDGKLAANGGNYAAGIGGGIGAGGTVTITGGTITANGGGSNAAGIGSNSQNAGGTIKISGGVVVATGRGHQVDIGSNNGWSLPVTITGGSVHPTRWTAGSSYVTSPKNANGTAVVSTDYTGTPGDTLTFGVADTIPYNYTFTVPSDGVAHLWLPSGATLPSGTADIVLGITASADAGGIKLTAHKISGSDSVTGYTWQRSTVLTGPFEDLMNTAAATSTDITVQDGTTYYYRVAPVVVGKFAAYSNTASATMPWLTDLTISKGTLTPVFASATNAYTASVANDVSSVTVTPTTDTPGATIKVNGTTVTSGTVSAANSLDVGTNAILIVVSADQASKTYTITVDRAAASGPGPIGETQSSLTTLLTSLGAELSPHSVAPLGTIPAGTGTPITGAVPGNATFAKKDAPAAAFPGYITLTPSFSSNVTLNGNTTGNTLALKYTVSVAGLTGFGNWGKLSDNERVALVNTSNIIFAYEYADKTWKALVGTGGIVSWADALKAGIVKFTSTGIELNYAVTDATGAPTANGGVLVIPDGAKDNKIVDPVWLLKGATLPTAITLNPTTLSLKVGGSETVTATFTPATTTERALIWSGTGSTVSVTKAASADTYTVKGLAEGIVTLTATASADKKIKATLAVTVLSDDADLIESLTVSPNPPYHTGDEVEVQAKLKRTPETVTARVERPDGKTDTPKVTVEGTDAWMTYTLASLGAYTVTMKATVSSGTATETSEKSATLTVTEDSVEKDSSSGGCNAAGLSVLALAALLFMKRR